MSINVENDRRQIIPRWTPAKQSRLYGVNSGNSDLLIDGDTDLGFLRCLNEWEIRRDLISAKELVGYAVNIRSIENEALNGARKFIKANDTSSIFKQILRENGSSIDCDDSIGPGKTPIENYYYDIRSLKEHIKNYPFDPFAWLDLAYYYTVLGLEFKANRALQTALGLNAANRLILRSAARFYVHFDDPDHALYVLRSSGMGLVDPWIAAAHLSISQAYDLKKLRVKELVLIAQNDDLSPLHRSELNGAISTLEFNSGSIKNGRKYLYKCLIDPTENSLAQAQYLHSKFDGDFRPSDYCVPLKHEALALQHFFENNFKKSNEEARSWFNFQPFSSKPALLSSYISSVHLNQHKQAIEIIDRALLSSCDDPILINNKAFALIQLKRIGEASELLKTIDLASLDSDQLATINATLGLIELENGNIQLGDKLYNETIKYFTRKGDNLSLSRAVYFYGTNLLRIDRARGLEQLKSAGKVAKKINSKEMIELTKKYCE